MGYGVEWFDGGGFGSAITLGNTVLDYVLVDAAGADGAQLVRDGGGVLGHPYYARGIPSGFVGFTDAQPGDVAEAWVQLIPTGPAIIPPAVAAVTSASFGWYIAAPGDDAWFPAADLLWLGSDSATPSPSGPGLYTSLDVAGAPVLTRDAAAFQWVKVTSVLPASGPITATVSSLGGATLWTGVLFDDIGPILGAGLRVGWLVNAASYGLFFNAAAGEVQSQGVSLFPGMVSLAGGAVATRGVRQWPRDDGHGVAPAARTYPPPKSGRTFGGYQ